VCDDGADSRARIDGAVAALKADKTVAPLIAGANGARPYNDEELAVVAATFGRGKDIARLMKRPEQLAAFTGVLEKLKTEGRLGRVVGEVKACMIYVDFRRRFGGGRAECLR
jgi:hypothetical protein